MSISTTVSHCRVCGEKLPEPFFDLGVQPLANGLIDDADEAEIAVPLELTRCGHCELVQLTETVNPEILFRDYVWVSGTASTTREYAEQFCDNVLQRAGEREDLFVVEVASNDGTFLQPFRQRGCRVQGVDPARNIAQIAIENEIPTYSEFFGVEAAKHVESTRGKADIVMARNVIPHVADVNDVIAGMKVLMQSSSVGVIEFHDSSLIQDELHYDSVYHEHLFYFTLTTLNNLLERHGLFSFDLTYSPISGGSVVVYFSLNAKPQSETYLSHMQTEADSGINSQANWHQFADQCAVHKTTLNNRISALLDNSKTVVAYGASARSSTLLNYCGINESQLVCVADQNPLKQGKFTPGSHIQICSPEEMVQYKPDAILLLAWNFADEITTFLRDELAFLGPVILPLPNEVSER